MLVNRHNAKPTAKWRVFEAIISVIRIKSTTVISKLDESTRLDFNQPVHLEGLRFEFRISPNRFGVSLVQEIKA